MKTLDFNRIMKRLQQPDGKTFFEDYLQYMGWWFLQLTEKQSIKMAQFLHTEFGYPLVELSTTKRQLSTPNGMTFTYYV